jgi:hypothetical protein
VTTIGRVNRTFGQESAGEYFGSAEEKNEVRLPGGRLVTGNMPNIGFFDYMTRSDFAKEIHLPTEQAKQMTEEAKSRR